MSNSVYWTVEGKLRDGHREAFRSLADEMVEVSKNDEPGTLSYEWFIGDDGATLHFVERFADSDAAMAHLAYFGTVAERFMSMVEVTRFTVYGNASEAVREAVGGMGAAFLAPYAGFVR